MSCHFTNRVCSQASVQKLKKYVNIFNHTPILRINGTRVVIGPTSRPEPDRKKPSPTNNPELYISISVRAKSKINTYSVYVCCRNNFLELIILKNKTNISGFSTIIWKKILIEKKQKRISSLDVAYFINLDKHAEKKQSKETMRLICRNLFLN